MKKSVTPLKQTYFGRTIITMLLLCTTVLVNAIDFTYNGLTYTILSSNTCKTKDGCSEIGNSSAGNSVSGYLNIPETAYDSDGRPYTVTAIGSYAFYGCSSLTAITIPTSVATIEGGAFRYCRGLTSITIPNSVTSIGEGAFYRCLDRG
jgi:hypothetical protein